MMDKVIYLLNGPPKAGKDTLGREVARAMEGGGYPCHLVKFAQPLKDGICATFGVSFEELEATKDEPNPLLMGKTFRKVQISMSENWMKKFFSESIFGDIMVNRIERGPPGAYVITDSGFQCEALPVVAAFGASSVLHVRLERRGHNFKGDSRNWIDPESLGIRTFTIRNNGTIGQMMTQFVGGVWR